MVLGMTWWTTIKPDENTIIDIKHHSCGKKYEFIEAINNLRPLFNNQTHQVFNETREQSIKRQHSREISIKKCNLIGCPNTFKNKQHVNKALEDLVGFYKLCLSSMISGVLSYLMVIKSLKFCFESIWLKFVIFCMVLHS